VALSTAPAAAIATEVVPPVPASLALPFGFTIQAITPDGRVLRHLDRPVRFTVDFSDREPHEWNFGTPQLWWYDPSPATADPTGAAGAISAEATVTGTAATAIAGMGAAGTPGTVRGWTIVPSQVDLATKRLSAEVDHFSWFAIGGTDVNQPSTGPNLEGYQVDLATGYAQAGIPLRLPPGVNGLQPDLTLRYNSGVADTLNQQLIAANPDNPAQWDNKRTLYQASPVGLGWSLDLGRVFREYEGWDGGPQFSYYLELFGQTYAIARVVPPGGGQVYVLKDDQYQRLELIYGANNGVDLGEYWLLTAKDGTQYRFGYTPQSAHRAAQRQYGDLTQRVGLEPGPGARP